MNDWPDNPDDLELVAPMAFDAQAMVPQHLPALADFITAHATAWQVPIDAVAILTLGLASAAAAAAVEVEVKDGWIEPLQLWCMALLPSGEKKSRLMSALRQPFNEWESKEHANLRDPLALYRHRRQVLEERLAVIRRQLAKGTTSKANARVTADDLRCQAETIAKELEAMPVLTLPSLTTGDATPEGLRDLLDRNGGKAALVSAEGDSSLLMGKRYGDGTSNMDLLLAGHAGDRVTVNRAGRDPQTLERPALSIACAWQPEALRPMLRDREAAGRGLTPRLLLVSPCSRIGWRDLNASAPPVHLEQWWTRTLTDLLALPWPGRVMARPDGTLHRVAGHPRTLRMTGDALTKLDAMRADAERRMRPDGDLFSVVSFASKLPGVICRMAAIYELMRDAAAVEVGGESMRAAIAAGAWLSAHHVAALGRVGERTERTDARKLLTWLRRHPVEVISFRDLHRALDHDAPAVRCQAAVDVLVDAGWLRPVESAPTGAGRPSLRYTTHPIIAATTDAARQLLDSRMAPSGDKGDNIPGRADSVPVVPVYRPLVNVITGDL